MRQRSLLRRLLSVEVLGGAMLGAGLPYLAALVVDMAPTRVPLGVVMGSLVGGAVMGGGLFRLIARRRRRDRETREIVEREQQERRETAERLERLERAVGEI